MAAAGFVLRDVCRVPVVAGARRLGLTSINVAECLALRDAPWVARSKGLKKISVEGDSKLVVEAVVSKCSVPWRLMSIIEDIRCIANFFDCISWSHIFCEKNFVADAVTSIGFQFGNLHIWDRPYPAVAYRALLFDFPGSGCSRGDSL
ncbi:uncharacterized protein [Pyrus communis]|uniref:uncharacterized protein n=1 Tax=Pyrus communis TaxID=23211 RepID=UPI0035BF0FEB